MTLIDVTTSQAAVHRLVGEQAFQKLQQSCVMIIGVGGVGSWCAEALGRSAVGTLILVDADEVCESNINRQILATFETVGQSKVHVLAKRLKSINPNLQVIVKEEFCTQQNIQSLIDLRPSLIIDAIDGVANKCLLIDQALKHSIPIICTGGGAGKLDVTQIKICDLAHTIHDPLLYRIRKKLRDKFNFSPYSKKKLIPFGVRTIYSTEMPKIILNDENSHCMIEGQACEQKMGSLVTVTSVIGMFAANETIQQIIHREDDEKVH